MNKFLKFILIGYFFAIIVELQFNYVTGNVGNFIFTLIAYPFYVSFVYFTSKIFNVIKKDSIADFFVWLVYGLLGLMIEWFIIGNSPWGNPEAIQIGMFSFWAAVAFMPRIFTIEGYKKIKKWIKIYFVVYLAIALPATFFVPSPLNLGLTTLLMTFFYTAMNGFYFWFMIKRRN